MCRLTLLQIALAVLIGLLPFTVLLSMAFSRSRAYGKALLIAVISITGLFCVVWFIATFSVLSRIFC
jgi:hypothetical protein